VPAISSFLDLPLPEKEQRGLLNTPAEIHQQPETWKTTLSIFEEHRQDIATFLSNLGVNGPVDARPSVLLIGAGTSDYIGRALEMVLRKEWGCEVAAVPSTDLLPGAEQYLVTGKRYLWIHFSRSGDSPEGVAVLEKALAAYPEIAHIVVTCNEQASMAKLCAGNARSRFIVLDDAVNDRSLAMTSSFTNMVVTGQSLAHIWSIESYRRVLESMIHAGERLLQDAEQLAAQFAGRNFARVCFVGGGALAGVASESALKVLELTAGQVKTMSETVLGLRHGPMAALDRETLLVCFAGSHEPASLYARDLMQEITLKDVVAHRVVVGLAGNRSLFDSCCDTYLAIDATIDDLHRPILDVIFGQLLGLHFSVAHGLKPDAPSPGGVISRVVKSFHIY
jgi:tagatose-6-phosphate ketose/aldose isomerase